VAPSVQRRKVWLTPTILECRTVTLPIYESARLGRKVNFAPGKIPLRSKSPRKCIYNLPAQETAEQCAKFGWTPLSDVAAVTKPRRETGWNLLGCHKLTNRSQLLVGRSCEGIWGRYCCLIFFPDFVDMCHSYEDISRQSCAMVRRWRIFGDFSRTVFSASRVQYVSDLHLKFALRPHHVWKYGSSGPLRFFSTIISRGSVATHLRCDGIFNYRFARNLPLSLSLEDFWKSIRSGKVRGKSRVAFFPDTVYSQSACRLGA